MMSHKSTKTRSVVRLSYINVIIAIITLVICTFHRGLGPKRSEFSYPPVSAPKTCINIHKTCINIYISTEELFIDLVISRLIRAVSGFL